jgi:hypothetical protein
MSRQQIVRYESVESIRSWGYQNVIGCIEYFEEGCLCIHSGKLPVLMGVSAASLLQHYLTGCVCSRHPDGEMK